MTDRLERFLHRDVLYTVFDEDGEFFGTVERDSNGSLHRKYLNHLLDK